MGGDVNKANPVFCDEKDGIFVMEGMIKELTPWGCEEYYLY
jgi:hypothetical protein